jgi:hypothetical protein
LADQDVPETSGPTSPLVRRGLIWLAAVGSILAALAVVVENAEKLTNAISSPWVQHPQTSGPAETSSPPATAAQQDLPTPHVNALIVGKWVNASTGETAIFEENGDVYDAKMGLGRYTASVTDGANLGIYFQNTVCHYYVIWIERGSKMTFALRRGGNTCASAVWSKAYN